MNAKAGDRIRITATPEILRGINVSNYLACILSGRVVTALKSDHFCVMVGSDGIGTCWLNHNQYVVANHYAP